MARGLLAACLLLLFQSPSIRFDSGRNLFVLEGWSAPGLSEERFPEVLSVSVDAADVPALIGSYRVEGQTLVFEPRFPLQPGVRYRAIARPPGLQSVSLVVDLPRPDVKPSTVVSRVYPTTSVLPENQLKFYIHFSAPMARGLAYDHVSLFQDGGGRVDKPFLELGEELWDPQGTRFTLFFDPGRIKRGLVSQEELGIALENGRRYTLVVDTGWLDATGNPLASEFRKEFSVGPADRTALSVSDWKVRTPARETRAALIVEFPEPMDHAILLRDLEVRDASGNPVTGDVDVPVGEKVWSFIPDEAWKSGAYTIRAGSAVADLAGNMIDRPFEIDRVVGDEDHAGSALHTLPFRIP